MGVVVVEQSQIERTEGAVAIADNKDKDKKKRRRSNRRSKQNSCVSACSSVNETHVETSEFLRSGSPSNCVAPNEQQADRASNVSFNSLPTMHLNEQPLDEEPGTLQNQPMFSPDSCERIFSNSCPQRIVFEKSSDSISNQDYIKLHDQRKYFATYWSPEAVTVALEKGDAFKALFRVNAHNRLEAYCKIDGVQTDVLISGTTAQNRAVEGDIVAISIDPLSLWTKMKGSNGASNNSDVIDESNVLAGGVDFVHDNCKGKDKVATDYVHGNYRNSLSPPEEGFHCMNGSYLGENASLELVGPTGNNLLNGYHCSVTNHPGASCSSEPYEIVIGLEKLCAIVNSFPSKRPTGRVVAIIERSSRRDAIVGFLNVKQWLAIKEGYRRGNKKNKLKISSSNHEYMLLTPTNPKLPKMMVPVKSLPNCIKKRLEDGDATVEMELVAAEIVEWEEEKNIPLAHVVHIFGKGGEIKSHIAAILFENAICSSEFSAEALSFVPNVPWEVPQQELKYRRDFRDLCIFTIDPATATDLDDALSVEMLSSGIFRVGVHIADVSFFIIPDTALDIEARIRSTSVYLLQQKLSMLPSLLSENLASLNPGVDRLAISIFWEINTAGKVLDRWIGRTIIHSCCKLSYEHAQGMIDGLFDESFSFSDNGWPQLHGHFQWSDVTSSVKILHEISKTLKQNRFNDGALSLQCDKVVLVFDKDGIPYDSVRFGQIESNYLVEEFMLLANRTAAEVIARAFPSSALLRRQLEPNLQKLKEFEQFCSKHGLDLDTSSGKLHHSLECIRRELKYDSVLIDILMSYAAKPMQLASYFCSGDLKEGQNEGSHYALAVPLYTHFTSPLRRYPDIVVHRILAATLKAEEMYLNHKRPLKKLDGVEVNERCFTGMCFDKDAVESPEAQEALSTAASRYRVPGMELLADVAAYCNKRKLAASHAQDATHKLYMWVLLKKKETLFSEARVLGLGPRFMSVYIQRLAMEHRIYYDEVEGLSVEWLESTSTLVLYLCANKHLQRRGSPGKCRTLEEVALVISPSDMRGEAAVSGDAGNQDDAASQTIVNGSKGGISDMVDIEPAVAPLTVRILSTIPVALHAVGGEDGPLDIRARLYISSYFR